MGDFMSNISAVHIFTESYYNGVSVQVVYKSGYKRTYDDFEKIPDSVRDFVSPEHYTSTTYTFSESGCPYHSFASHFHSDPVCDSHDIRIVCLDELEEDEPEEVEPEEVEPEEVELEEGVCPYPTCSFYGGCPNYCKYSSGNAMHCALDSYALQVPEFDLEIYVTGAYDCTLEQSARVTVGLHGCPTEFHDLEAYTDNDGYLRIIVDDVYKRLPFLRTCPFPVLRDSYAYNEYGRRHVVEIWKIPLPSHYLWTPIHRVWRGCGTL